MRFPVGLMSLRLLAICFLSQARLLGGLPRASPVPFRASYFTSELHPSDATAQRLIVCLYRRWGFTHCLIAPRGAQQSSHQDRRMACPGQSGASLCHGAAHALDRPTQIGSRIRTMVARWTPMFPGPTEIIVSGRSTQANSMTEFCQAGSLRRISCIERSTTARRN